MYKQTPSEMYLIWYKLLLQISCGYEHSLIAIKGFQEDCSLISMYILCKCNWIYIITLVKIRLALPVLIILSLVISQWLWTVLSSWVLASSSSAMLSLHRKTNHNFAAKACFNRRLMNPWLMLQTYSKLKGFRMAMHNYRSIDEVALIIMGECKH